MFNLSLIINRLRIFRINCPLHISYISLKKYVFYIFSRTSFLVLQSHSTVHSFRLKEKHFIKEVHLINIGEFVIDTYKITPPGIVVL